MVKLFPLFLIGILFLQLATCSSHTEKQADTLFQIISSTHSGITFANHLQPTEAFNIIEYLYYYNGGGVAAGDVNNDGWIDLFFTANEGPDQLYLNQGNFQFEDASKEASISEATHWSTGVTMADVNADGWLDIYVCRVGGYKGLPGKNELYLNQQDGTFQEQAAAFGLDFQGFSTQAAFFDYDQDGDLDMYLLNHSVHSTENYVSSSIRQQRDSLAGDRLYRNDAGKFVDVSAAAGIYGSRVGFGLGIVLGDLNNDGCPDIYVSNDFHENDYLYYNNCDGTFREATPASLGHTSTFSMGSDIGDFNNDGWLDILSLDMKPSDETVLKSSVGADPYNIYRFKLRFGYHHQFPRNMLHLNRGPILNQGQSVQFSEIGQMAGIATTDWSWSALFCDLDSDGWQDVFITNGIWQRPNDLDYLKYTSNQEIQRSATNLEMAAQMPPGQVSNRAFKNKGQLQFSDQSTNWGLDEVGAANGAVYADLDNDGDLDIVTNNLNAPANLFRNTRNEQPDFHYAQIQLRGDAQNQFGVGSRVQIWADSLWQTQELYPTRGFQSAVAPRLTFGLKTAAPLAKVQVRWPDGRWEEWQQVAVDQPITLQKSSGQEVSPAQEPAPWFNLATDAAGLDFRHQENNYNDFDREVLMPHMLSTLGPKLASGDVNGDERADLYVCGARGQSGKLYLQLSNGNFTQHPIQDAFLLNQASEETDATFFDADQDGDLDLYVVSGGGEPINALTPAPDQLYLNDGRGQFSSTTKRLPPLAANGACVVAWDFNADGALDLFVGSRSVPGHYGRIPDSYLLQNDGTGHFTNVSVQFPALARVGMVTEAAVMPVGATTQLVVVGAWMPVTIFAYQDNEMQATTIPQSNGWWHALAVADLDKDGDADLLLGNLGLNADLQASTEQPLRLLVGDFDRNGSTDPILTYYKNGREYTYFGKDELSNQMVSIKKRFPAYQQFAASSFAEVFDRDLLAGASEQTIHKLSSAYAENLGDGTFALHDFPRSAQMSPIFAFATADVNSDGYLDVLGVGNLYDVQPALGRYDASYGLTMLGTPNGEFSELEPQQSGFAFRGEGRDLVWLSDQNGKQRIIVATNNGNIKVFTK